MSKKRALIRLDHPATRKKKDFLKTAKRILTWKNFKKFFLYSFFGFSSFILLLFAWFAKDLPSPNKINSRLLAESTKIFDRNGNLIYEIHGDKNRTLISFEEMPKYIKDATVAIEDKEFYKHKGFSFRGIARAFTGVIEGKNRGGGSTITQQFVKNALLTSERTYSRKIKELILSTEIEIVYSKNDILKMYLNEIPYGSNAYGIEAASKTYFGKSAKDLTLAESATLAAMPKAPTYYSPYGSHKDQLLARKDLVLDKMAEQNLISEEEAEKAKEEKLAFTKRQESITYPHFVMYVKEKLVEKYGEKLVEEGGLRVTTTIDPEKQKLAEDIISNKAPQLVKKYGASNASLVSVDPKTGQILAMVGSVDYFNEAIDGNVNVAIRDRQPGSSFKPFAYATAWKKDKYGPGTPMFDLRTDFGGTPPYKPENYDGREHGLQTMRSSLAQSLNIPSVKALYMAGVKETIDTAHDMGITTLNQDPSHYGLSLVLGGGEVKLLDMTSSFGVFANKGEKKDVTPILKVENSKGKILEEYKDKKGKQVLDPQIAYLTSSVLSDNSARAPIFGSNSPLTFGKSRPVAAKTGTTQEWRDAWTIGYTPSLVTGVWAGNNDNSVMKKGADGVYVAAPLWNEFMTKALAGTPVEQFEKPQGIKKVTLDKVTGKKTMEGSETVTDEFPSWYKLEKASSGKGYKINKVDGKLATEDCPPEAVETIYSPQVQAEIPPKDPAYPRWIKPIAAWAKSHGFGMRIIPTEYTDLCSVEKRPSISLSLSSNYINLGESVTATTSVSAPLGVSKVEFFLDDNLVGTDTTEPYSKTITPSLAGSRKITAKVKDNGANTASDSVSVYVSGSGSIPGVNFNLSADPSKTTFTATISGDVNVNTPVKLYLIKNSGEEDIKNMSTVVPNAQYTWSGSTAGYKSAYAKAETNKGTVISNIISW